MGGLSFKFKLRVPNKGGVNRGFWRQLLAADDPPRLLVSNAIPSSFFLQQTWCFSYLCCDLHRSQSLLYVVPQSSWLDYCDLLLELLLLHLSLLCQQGSIMLWVLMLLFSCPCRVYNTFVTTYLVPTRSFGMWCQQGFWR